MKSNVLVLLVLATIVLAGCGQATAPAVQSNPTTAPAQSEPTTASSQVAAPTEVPAASTQAPEPTEPPVAPQQEPKRLKVALTDLEKSGWALESDDASILTRAGVIEGLLKVDFDGNAIPWLAESWEQTDDLTWEFKLRSGVTFHNGETLNAEAVVTAVKYVLGVATLPRGFTAKTIASIEAKGDDVVVMKTTDPDPLLPLRFAQVSLGILAPSAYKAGGLPSPVGTGTGPFVIVEAVPEQSLLLARNEKYWGTPPKLDEVDLFSVPDPTVRAGMVQTGEVDVARAVPISMVPVLENDENVAIVRRADPRTVTLYLNNETGPLKDVKVRQAVSYAIDRQAIVDAVLEGIGTAASGPFVPGEPWQNPDVKGYAYDPEKAKQLLAEAGFGEGELKLRLWTYPKRSEFPPMAVAIQNMLSKAGIQVEVRLAEWVTLQPDVMAGNYDMLIYSRGHLVDLVDPEAFLTADYTCEGTNNFSHYCNTKVDELVGEVRSLGDKDARYEIFKEIESILNNEAVDVWINYSDQVDAISTKVQNYKIHLLGFEQLTPELDIAQ